MLLKITFLSVNKDELKFISKALYITNIGEGGVMLMSGVSTDMSVWPPVCDELVAFSASLSG